MTYDHGRGATYWPFVGSIYGVRALVSSEYRYVGLTTNTVMRRRSEHWKAADKGTKTPFYDWLRKQRDREASHFESLELVMSEGVNDLGAAEQRWIEKLREEGHRLLNLTEGGIGPRGYVWTKEQREAAADRMRGTKRPAYPRGPDHRTWGTTWTDEARSRLSVHRKGMNSGAANPNFGKFAADHPSFGRSTTPETRARLSEQKRGARNPNFGKVMTPEERQVRSDALRGRPMPSSVRSAHTRYHTNRGIYSDKCRHCIDDAAQKGSSR